jgi:hypothetical protein
MAIEEPSFAETFVLASKFPPAEILQLSYVYPVFPFSMPTLNFWPRGTLKVEPAREPSSLRRCRFGPFSQILAVNRLQTLVGLHAAQRYFLRFSKHHGETNGARSEFISLLSNISPLSGGRV